MVRFQLRELFNKLTREKSGSDGQFQVILFVNEFTTMYESLGPIELDFKDLQQVPTCSFRRSCKWMAGCAWWWLLTTAATSRAFFYEGIVCCCCQFSDYSWSFSSGLGFLAVPIFLTLFCHILLTSGSGASAYIEPAGAVPLNNKLSEARAEVAKAEYTVLLRLTDQVVDGAHD